MVSGERWSSEVRGHGGAAISVVAPMVELGICALEESRELEREHSKAVVVLLVGGERWRRYYGDGFHGGGAALFSSCSRRRKKNMQGEASK